jgi:hypothetical protein
MWRVRNTRNEMLRFSNIWRTSKRTGSNSQREMVTFESFTVSCSPSCQMLCPKVKLKEDHFPTGAPQRPFPGVATSCRISCAARETSVLHLNRSRLFLLIALKIQNSGRIFKIPLIVLRITGIYFSVLKFWFSETSGVRWWGDAWFAPTLPHITLHSQKGNLSTISSTS